MVVVLLLAIGLQTLTGLVMTDDVFWSGPFREWVPEYVADWGGGLHQLIANGLQVLVLIHISAVVFHQLRFKESLLAAMFHGRKPRHQSEPVKAIRTSIKRLSAILLIAGAWAAWLWSLPI